MKPEPQDASVRTANLQTFFEQWRAFDPSVVQLPLEARLERLFAQLRSSLATADQHAVETLPATPLRAETLAPFLSQLHVAVSAARLQGALLNVWAISGLKRDEVRNAGVLAALFSPVISGDRAVPFLAKFLARVREGDRSLLPTFAELQDGYSVQTEACPLGAVDDRVDLSIEGDDFILLIEVKIDAGEGTEQLARYESVLRLKAKALGKRAALVYLSPSPAKAPPPNTFYADWADVRRAAQAVAWSRPHHDRSFQDLMLAQFAEHVRQF